MWKAKPCVWKTDGQLFMRSSLHPPHLPGAVYLPFPTCLLSYVPPFLPFTVSCSLIVLSVLCFFPFLQGVDIVPSCTPSSSSSLPVPPHPEGSLRTVLAPDPDGKLWTWAVVMISPICHQGGSSFWCALGRMNRFFLTVSEINHEKTSPKGWSAYINVGISIMLNYHCSNNR